MGIPWGLARDWLGIIFWSLGHWGKRYEACNLTCNSLSRRGLYHYLWEILEAPEFVVQRCRYVIKEISCAVSIDKSDFLMKLKQTKVPLRTTKNLVCSESCCWWLVPCLWLWYLFTFLQEMVMIMMMMFLMILMMMMVTCLDTSSWPTDPSTAATTHHVSQRPGHYCRQNHQLQSFEMIFFNHQKEIICVFLRRAYQLFTWSLWLS